MAIPAGEGAVRAFGPGFHGEAGRGQQGSASQSPCEMTGCARGESHPYYKVATK